MEDGRFMECGTDIDGRIHALYPETLQHRIRVRSLIDETHEVWQIQFSRGKYVMRTLIERAEADRLLAGEKSIALTVEIQQMLESLALLEMTDE